MDMNISPLRPLASDRKSEQWVILNFRRLILVRTLGRAIADQVPGVDGDKAEEFVAESIRDRLY
jgi:hypothetical protein